MGNKFIKLGILAILIAGASMVAEMFFYSGRMSESGVLQESFFLPLSFILMFVSLLFFILGGLIKLAKENH